VLLGLLHEAEMLLQFPGFEPAGTGEESPGSGQILLDQLCPAHGLPGDGGPAGQD
jgi:hypothetical protein